MNKRIPIFIGLLFVACLIWLQTTNVPIFSHFLNRLENLTYDLELQTQLKRPDPTVKNAMVAIIDVDDKSLKQEGRWPWPRAKLAELVMQLREAGAVVIVLDMVFPQPESNIAEEVWDTLEKKHLLPPNLSNVLKKSTAFFNNDTILAESLRQSDTVIGFSFLLQPQFIGTLPKPVFTLTTPEEKKLAFINTRGYVVSIPMLQNTTKSSGFINVFADQDGVIRRVPILMRYKDGLYPMLAVEAVRLYLLSPISLVTASYGKSIRLEGVKIANHYIPTNSLGEAIIPFVGRSFTFPYFSAADVLNNALPKDALSGKIVFVGTSAAGLGDVRATAAQSAFPGVEIQATIAHGILNDYFSYRPDWARGAEVACTLIFGLLFAFSFPYLGPRILTLVVVTVPVGILYCNSLLWDETGLIISIFIPVFLTVVLAILNMLYGYLFETRRREYLKDMFGQYVPEGHIDFMLKAPKKSYGMYGEDREMTVLFCDIRNFTAISENLSASQLKEMLNEFFTPMTEIIFKHHGTIDKYVGDLIMAFWGAPLKDKRHMHHALSAAIDMQKKIIAIQPLLKEHGWPEIRVGIGLNTGVMSVGDMGSRYRRNYTVLGDAVNLASRVESLTRHYGVYIIVTEDMSKQKDFIFRQLDKVRVKGKEKSVGIYELICKRVNVTADIQYEIKLSDQALSEYFKGSWENALELFTNLKTAYPHKKLYEMYIHRIEKFLASPPLDWDGVYSMGEKQGH